MADNQTLYLDFLEYFSKDQCFSPATIRSYRYVLRLFVGWLGLRHITEVDMLEVSKFFGLMAHKVKPESVNTYKCIVKAFLVYLIDYREIKLAVKPALIKRAKIGDRKIHHYSVEEVNSIIELVDTPQDKLVIALMYETGMRIGEIVSLRVSDIKGRAVEVRGKGAKDRVVYISVGLQGMINQHLWRKGIVTGTVFRHETPKHSSPNTGFSVQGLRLRLQRQLTPQGIHFRPHWVRHTMATEMLNGGANIRAVQEYLGHSRIDTTQLYTHVTNTQLLDAHDNHLPSLSYA